MADQPTGPNVFPFTEVEVRLRRGLEKAAAEGNVLRGDWEPVLDSMRVASMVVTLEDLFDFRLPPEKIVRVGGYASVEEGVADMRERLQLLWQKHQRRKEGP